MSGHKTVKGEAEAEAGDGARLLWDRQDKVRGEEPEPGRMENNPL